MCLMRDGAYLFGVEPTSVVITVKNGQTLGDDYRNLALWFMVSDDPEV